MENKAQVKLPLTVGMLGDFFGADVFFFLWDGGRGMAILLRFVTYFFLVKMTICYQLALEFGKTVLDFSTTGAQDRLWSFRKRNKHLGQYDLDFFALWPSRFLTAHPCCFRIAFWPSFMDTLPKTKRSPLKSGWETSLSFWEGMFSGANC